MKKNSGITLITLIVMIIIIIILTSIFIATGLDSLNEAKNSKNINEIHQLEQAISNKFTSYIKNDGRVNLIGKLVKSSGMSSGDCVDKIIETLDFDDKTNDEKIQSVAKISSNISRDYDEYVMFIYSGDMQKLGMENYSEKNVYIVDYYTGSVYGPIDN